MTNANDTPANVGAENTGITGDELFEKFDGTNYDELNQMLAASQEAADTDDASSGEESCTQAENAEQVAEGDNSDATSSQVEEKPVQSENEKKFSQKDVDYFLGKKTSKLQGKFTSLIDDLAVLMGVDKSDVVNTVRRQVMEREASDKGVVDTDSYVRQRELEEENEQLRRRDYEREYFNEKITSLQQQSDRLGVDFLKLSENEEFVNAVNLFYSNEGTRNRAIELAYHGLYFDELLSQRAQDERSKIISTVEAGQSRMVEGARETVGASAAKIDVSKMNDDEIAKMAERAMAGEKIIL